MIKDYEKIMSMSVEEVISSSHSITLLRLYSKLYLNGAAPRVCAASQRKYYKRLKKDFMKNTEKLEKTHVLAFQGRRYIPGVFNKDGELIAGHLHISSEYLTDELAAKYLKDGVLKKDDFIRLPGEKAEKIEYSKDDVIEIIAKDEYKPMLKVAKDLELVKGNPSKEDVEKALKEYLA